MTFNKLKSRQGRSQYAAAPDYDTSYSRNLEDHPELLAEVRSRTSRILELQA